jgi:hypothetical protein
MSASEDTKTYNNMLETMRKYCDFLEEKYNERLPGSATYMESLEHFNKKYGDNVARKLVEEFRKLNLEISRDSARFERFMNENH